MKQQYLKVEFDAVESRANNCICDACHWIGSVKKLRLPRTKFYEGGKLSTIYTNYWLCDGCEDDLKDALDYAKREVSNAESDC